LSGPPQRKRHLSGSENGGQARLPSGSLESVPYFRKSQESRATVERAAEIADWAYEKGYDAEHGGIVAFLDALGAEPVQTEWRRETGMRWDDEVRWVHSEALYCLALCAVELESDKWFGRFLELHEWCWAHFNDEEFGEWYPQLSRDGTPKNTDKGTLWKAAYHVPGALLNVALILERAAKT